MMDINGKTRVIGLFGNPIEHTLSPFIHNRFAEKTRINTAYLPFLIEKECLKEAVLGAKALNLIGNNVTVPFKTEILPFVDIMDEEAEQIGAVNTLKYSAGKVYGYNTDAYGLLKSCEMNGVVFENKSICIIGAGGAAKAVAMMCARQKVKSITIVNRSIEHAELLKNSINQYFDLPIDVTDFQHIENTKSNICFQTTSLGMHPHVDASPIEHEGFFNGMEWAIDIIYNPYETKFLKLAALKNVKTLNGLGMLFYQAAKAFEIWHEITLSKEILQSTFKELEGFVYK